MNAGPLNKRISIEYPVRTAGDYGAAVSSWALLATVYANVQDAIPSRDESVQQGMAMARSRTRIRFRYRADVTPGMRITVRGATDRVFNIVGGPAELGQHEYTEVYCEAYSS